MKHPVQIDLFMTPGLTDNAYNIDLRDGWRAAIAEVSKVIDGVIVCPRHWREEPNAWEHPYMVKLVDTIRTNDLVLTNARRLWPTRDYFQLGFLNAGDPAFYAAVLANLYAERKRLGCSASWLYAEPHDTDAQDRHFLCNKDVGWKYIGFMPADEQLTRDAIDHALGQVPPADFVEPGFALDEPAGRPHYSHALADLGVFKAHRGTYRAMEPAAYPIPDDQRDEVFCCGFWVDPDPTSEAFVKEHGPGVLSPADFMEKVYGALPAWKAWFKNLQRIWIYTLAEHKADTMMELARLAA